LGYENRKENRTSENTKNRKIPSVEKMVRERKMKKRKKNYKKSSLISSWTVPYSRGQSKVSEY